MSRWVVVPFAATCLVGALLFAPFLLRDRDLVASTPSPRPLFNVTFIPVDGQLCVSDVTIPHDARELRFQLRTPGPVRVTLSAHGYRAMATGTGAVGITPPRTTRLGTVCLRPQRRGELTGTTEPRTLSRPHGAVDGRPIATDAYLAFYARRQASALAETPQIVHRMGAFRPGVVGPWLLWPLLALVVLGIPAALLAALLAGARRGRW
jgi:hypothetical protein